MEPFHLFPEELWEMILEKLYEPDDIQNLFYGIPELKQSFFASFGASCVFPMLFPKYLSFKDVLNCRLHSKDWKAAVDRTLVTHPDRKPYQSTVFGLRNNRVTLKSPFNYQVLNQFANKKEMTTSSDIHKEIMRLPEEVNPFVGRSLTIQVGSDSRQVEAPDELTQMQPILKKFGRHVHYAVLSFGNNAFQNWGHFVKRTLDEFLSHLPNLKSLKLDGDLESSFHLRVKLLLDDNEDDIGGNDKFEQFQLLEDTWWSCDDANAIRTDAHIETLDLTDLTMCQPDSLLNLFTALVLNNHLQKLVVNAEDWDDRFVPLCKSLKELSLKWQTSTENEREILETVRCILHQLRRHDSLLNLSITTWQIVKFYCLLDCLREFSLESIELRVKNSAACLTEDSGYGRAPLTFFTPTIRHLTIDDSVGFTINQLRVLPNLEYFGVRMEEKTETMSMIFGCDSRFVKNLFERNATCPMVGNSLYVYFVGLDRPGAMERPIWDVLSNLKMFTLLNCFGVVCRRYVRECRSKVFMG